MVVIPSPEGFAAGMEHGRVGGSAIRLGQPWSLK